MKSEEATAQTRFPAQNGPGQVHQDGDEPPLKATEAVLLASGPVPEDARVIKGIDFDAFPLGVTVNDLIASMATTGFQASSVADAVSIINDMVSIPHHIGNCTD